MLIGNRLTLLCCRHYTRINSQPKSTTEQVARILGHGIGMLSRFRYPVVPIGVVLGLLAGLIAVPSAGVIQAQPPWPTPPPAPVLAPPVAVPSAAIVAAPVPQVAGSVSSVVQPLFAGSLPRVPPLPKTVFSSAELDPARQIKVHIEAGSILRTLQLVYEPVPIEKAPKVIPSQEVIRSFELRAFDHEANSIDPKIHRPWLLEVPLGELKELDVDPSTLLLANYLEDEKRWRFLVTSYYPHRDLVTTRILKVGKFALVADRSPYR